MDKKQGLSSSIIKSIVQDTIGNLWLGTGDSGLVKYERNNKDINQNTFLLNFLHFRNINHLLSILLLTPLLLIPIIALIDIIKRKLALKRPLHAHIPILLLVVAVAAVVLAPLVGRCSHWFLLRLPRLVHVVYVTLAR